MQEKVEKREFILMKNHTDNNGSDMLTKNLPMDLSTTKAEYMASGRGRQRADLDEKFSQ